MDVVTYMKINSGTNGSFFTMLPNDDRPFFKPTKPRYRILDPIYHIYDSSDLQKCRVELRCLFNRYLYFKRIEKFSEATQIYKMYLIEKQKYQKLTRVKENITKRKTMERTVYIENLIYEIETDHRINDLELKGMVVDKLNELLVEVMSNNQEDEDE